VTSLEELRRELAAAGDPVKAEVQQRYMKSAMPYHGLAAPELKHLLRPRLREFAPPDRATWERTVRAVWDGATHREEWYAAIALARHRSAHAWQDVNTLDLHRHLVATGAWWDVVDETAQHLVGACLLADRDRVTPVLRGWAADDVLWVRRTAVICQLGHGDRGRPRPAHLRDRAQPRRPVVLAPQGDRLGTPAARAHRSCLGAWIRRLPRRSTLPALAP
jgi:3-methyladenine DNA glycosylase AlkD